MIFWILRAAPILTVRGLLKYFKVKTPSFRNMNHNTSFSHFHPCKGVVGQNTQNPKHKIHKNTQSQKKSGLKIHKIETTGVWSFHADYESSFIGTLY